MARSAYFCSILACLFLLIKSTTASEVATIYTSYFPNVVMDDPEKPGIAYEIVSELFKHSQYDYKIIPLPWARAQEMAKNTPNSLIFPLSWTPTRDKNYSWGVNIFNNQTYFITFDNTNLTVQSAREKRIGVQLKSSWDNWLTEQGFKNVHRVPGEGSELIKLLQNKRIHAWYTDQIIANSVLKELTDPGITYSDPVQVFQTYLATHRMVPYPHMAQLNKAMEALKKSGKLEEIYIRYGISPNGVNLTSNLPN